MNLRTGRLLLLCAALGGCDSSDSSSWTVDAGALKMDVVESPWRLAFYDGDGVELLVEYANGGAGPVGSIGVFPGPPPEGSGGQAAMAPLEMGEPATPPQRGAGWVRATELVEETRDGEVWVGTLATADPEWTIEVRARRAADGVIALSFRAIGDGAQAMSVAFDAAAAERFVGFGERGNGVDQAGRTIESYVAEGPYQDGEYGLIGQLVPEWGVRWRRDTTYFPIPWLLSSRGYGVLLDNDEISYHRIASDVADAWSVEVESDTMELRVFAGPRPADVLRRFSETVGRQPHDYAPWFFGPWVQPDSADRITELREADVPTSVTATFTHYLPCGSQRGNEDGQRERTARAHADGTAIHTYFNPMICADYLPEFANAEDADALIKTNSGDTYVYDYFTSRVFAVSQFDFAAPNGVAAYKAHTDEALSHGYEGWMEDFGEYTPLDAVSADGATGTEFHNRYARDYHCGVAAATADAGMPLARFVRSGWTGSAACSPIVWGGDPTTSFGFDGLESSIYQALSMGTSGVGIWGSDIGGFFAIDPNSLDGELLDRWISFGALTPIMRSQKDGLAVPLKERPQPWDPEHIDLWRKFAKLHTQLYPYVQAAAEEYYATGMPIMRHHLLTHPDDTAAHDRDDQYLFGPDLLVAPVIEAGASQRELYLPAGAWVEWWRSVEYDTSDGSFHIASAHTHQGPGETAVDAPLDEIPMFVRAGAVIAMLAPDVQTLAEHGDDPSIVHLSDRAAELHVLAFPRGQSAGAFYDTGTWESRASSGQWSLSLTDTQPRDIHLQAAMHTLGEPFEPCAVMVGDTELSDADWTYDVTAGVLMVRYRSDAGDLVVTGC